MMDLEQTLETSPPQTAYRLFRFALEHNLGQIASRRKLLQHFLEALRLCLGADSSWIYRVRLAGGDLRRPLREGPPFDGEEEMVTAFAAQQKPVLPPEMLLAPVRVQERLTWVVGVGRKDGFPRGDGYRLLKLTALLVAELSKREDERVREVLSHIKEEILREVRPRDLSYQILDGLRQLVRYDHSAALLVYDAAAGVFRIEAEKIAWTKAKSPFIGQQRPVSASFAENLRRLGARVSGLPRKGPKGQGARRLFGQSGDAAGLILEPQGELASIVDYFAGADLPSPTSTLCAPLVFRGEFLGILRIAAWRRPAFNRWDAEVVQQFLFAAANSLSNAHTRLDQERQALEAARSGHLVSVARVVAHDVNNALGTILPLAQQAVADLGQGKVEPEVLREDLELIVEKAELCRSIFSRLLRQVRSTDSRSHDTDLNRVVKDRRDLLAASLRRRGVDLQLVLAKDLPRARIYRQHLEHILWNLVHNALDALPLTDGRIVVTTSLLGPHELAAAGDPGGSPRLRLEVADNGSGISPENQQRVFEPFFSTKREGTGLGLPLCLSLARENQGTLRLESKLGEGTRVIVELPVAGAEDTSTGVVPS